MPLFCDISGIGAYKIIGTTFLIVVDELHRGCKSFFAIACQFFSKSAKCSELGPVALIRNILTVKKKRAKQPRKKLLLTRFATDFKRKHC